MSARTWRELITLEMKDVGDNWDNLVSYQPPTLQLDLYFDSSYGGSEGTPFVLWTTDYVYFPVVYDGAEWVGAVPRNPDTVDFEPQHFGGE